MQVHVTAMQELSELVWCLWSDNNYGCITLPVGISMVHLIDARLDEGVVCSDNHVSSILGELLNARKL